MSGESERTEVAKESDTAANNGSENTTSGSENALPTESIGMVEILPSLHTPHRKRKTILIAGVLLATLDLCCLPITYYYALHFDTGLGLQDVFAVITGVYGMLSFGHYALRSLRLFRSKTAPKYRPIGWTKWGMLEFLQVNILIIITFVEIELVAGTAPNNPIVRLCAMPSPTICFYLGFLFCISAIATQIGWKIPFNMSSTEKGNRWRPALLAFIEDVGAIEAQGGVEYRAAVMKRYEISPKFRRMLLLLTWGWGIGLICVATAATVLIIELDEDTGFGVGWGLPWLFSAVWVFFTVIFVKTQLRKEKADWVAKGGLIPVRTTETPA